MSTPLPPHPDRIRIVSTPGICGGRPRIDGHRITVEDVVFWHERQGMTPGEIVADYPTLTLSDVHAALAYYHRCSRSDVTPCQTIIYLYTISQAL